MAAGKPNILLIMTDQQRGDCLGIEDHPVLQTPYLDWIGSSGIHFRRAYSTCPVCVPARRSLISGREPVNHGLLMNGSGPLPGPTLPQVLADEGYQTHLVGKGHFGQTPAETGFQTSEWADAPRPNRMNAYQRYLHSSGITRPKASAAHGALGNGWVTRPWHLEERFHFTNWCTDEAIRFLEDRSKDKPFFLMLSFLHPHQPLTPPPFYYDMYMQQDLPEPYVGDWSRVYDKPVRGLPIECWRLHLDPLVMKQYRAAYFGSITHIDHQIGRLFDKSILPQDTIIAFCADHGEMLGDHQWIRKRTAYEPSARIPMLMRFPDSLGLTEGLKTNLPVILEDVMPTLLDASGIEVPESVDGCSLLPALKNADAEKPVEWRTFVHGECCEVPSMGSGMQYLTDGRRKYVWWPGRGEEQYFNLDNDPQELTDLANHPQYQEEISHCRQHLIDELKGRPEGFTDGQKLMQLEGPTPIYITTD